MGEIAEMMLDGTLCGDCGTLIDGEDAGYPRYCCRSDRPEKEERFQIALKKLEKAGLNYKVCNESNFHIKVGEWNFWAWTGKIYHPKVKVPHGKDRGIGNFIQLLKENS